MKERDIKSSWWYHRPVLYRVFDANDRLIYVGASHVLHFRMETHATKSWWSALARRVAWEFHPTKESALAAEAVAIQEEQPPFNVRHTGRKETDWTHLTADDEACARAWLEEDRTRRLSMPVFLWYHLDGIPLVPLAHLGRAA